MTGAISISPAPIPGVLLAGGKSWRMGGREKCLLELAGRPLLDHVIGRAQPQVDVLILNAPGDPARFASFGLEVAADVIDGFAGPLAGVLTGMEWARTNTPQARHIATFPCDAPFLPNDLVARLREAAQSENAAIALAASAGREHPAFALWPVEMMEDLRRATTEEGLRRMGEWTARCKAARVEYPCQPVDPFFNINSPQDLAEAERILSHSRPSLI